MAGWSVERIVHFEADDTVVDGFAHFGFHVRDGNYYAVLHQRHWLGRVDAGGGLSWTVAAAPVFPDVPNIHAPLEYPMFVEALADGSLLVSNLGNAALVRIDQGRMAASVLVDGRAFGMADMGNCVVDREGFIWVNEVTGCRLWRFGPDGRTDLVLGDGQSGFNASTVDFEHSRFSWIYDIRLAPDGRLYVLDSRNFALRVVDLHAGTVATVAGCGKPGYEGDGGNARLAAFGSDPTARFDGPISLAVDEAGNAFIGDRFNHVVRMVDSAGTIQTIAGRPDADDELANDPRERDPRQLNLPQISSLDYATGRLYVPTDLNGDRGDLVVLARS